MVRVKKGLTKRRRHKKILKQAKGYKGARSKLVKTAKEALMHAGEYAFAGRKQRKRQKRRLWISQINAALKREGLSYSSFLNGLKQAKIEIDRKILADIVLNDQTTFKKIIEKVKLYPIVKNSSNP